MAQTGYTPILIYSSSTGGNAPAAGNLTNSTLGSELAINITDGKLFYKDNANAVQVIGWKVVPATAGGTGQTSYAVGDLLYADSTTSLAKLADVATGNALISGGVGVAPSWGKIGLTTHVTGTLETGNGGTGLASYTAGDLVYYASGTAFTKLGIGTNGQVLKSTGSAPAWENVSALAVSSISFGTTGLTPSTATQGAVTVAGTLVAANGGTGQSSYTIGDILYASGTTTLSKLADVATGNALISGGVGVAPSWGKIGLTTHVSGTLPVANGGTGTATAFTAGSVVYAGASGTYTQNNGSFFWDANNVRLGLGTNSPSQLLSLFANANSPYMFASDGTTSTLYGTSTGLAAGLLGTTTNHPLIFWINNGDAGRFEAGGNFVIGATSARSKFNVVGDITLGANPAGGSAGTNYSITGNTAASGNANGGALTVLAGGGSGSGTNGDLILRAGQTASPGSITTGGSVYIDTGKPSDSLSGGSHVLRRYTGNPSALSTSAEWDTSGYYTCLGVYNATVGGTNRDVYVDNTGLVGYVSSTRESKKNIAPMDDVSWLMQLQPVTFNRRKKQQVFGNPIQGTDVRPVIGEEYVDEVYEEIEYGLIADDTEPINPDLCFYDETETGKKLAGIQYSKLVTPMLKKIQQQQQAIDYLIDEIQKLKGQK